ncbi:hypothetical protein D1631_06250 [Chryseobacterium nematophagum]|uniref:Signal peptidase n=1 Tax=Chryseobacterium nematophagum TaxID=2305228 RepID=A0A3M7TE27_9FLAO|nr:hypothetical protein [Chryseobacterium nematophagum]RNA61558.1 hypothetical protein D1631_06250 [Chryseobacterium nematophagum]
MKKIILILSIAFSGCMYAQDDEVPAEPGDPAPIDMYISALYAIGVGLAVYCLIKKPKKNTST